MVKRPRNPALDLDADTLTYYGRAYLIHRFPSRIGLKFVASQRPQPEEPTNQLTRFKLGTSRYQVLVTNLPLQPLNLRHFTNDRAGVELLIKLLKGDYPLGSIPTRHFFVNATSCHLLW